MLTDECEWSVEDGSLIIALAKDGRLGAEAEWWTGVLAGEDTLEARTADAVAYAALEGLPEEERHLATKARQPRDGREIAPHHKGEMAERQPARWPRDSTSLHRRDSRELAESWPRESTSPQKPSSLRDMPQDNTLQDTSSTPDRAARQSCGQLRDRAERQSCERRSCERRSA